MSFELRDSQEFKIDELVVVTKTGQGIDITNIYEEINIFDSLFLPVMSGRILVRDSIGLSGKLIFDGSESLLMTITKDPNSDVANFKRSFRIYKQSERREEGLNSEYYFLNFVSDELMYSDQKRVNQSYENTYSGIIERILLDYLKVPQNKLGGVMEPSSGLKKVVIPNLRPIEAIEWCTKRSIDQRFAPNFMFWENVTGYNYATLSTLLTKPDILDIKFEAKNTSSRNPIQEMSSARSVEVVAQTDGVEETRSGVNAGKFIAFDPLTRIQDKREISYGDHFDSMKHANDNPNTTVIKNREGKENVREFDSKKTMNMFESSRRLSNYVKQNEPESFSKFENYEDMIFQRKAILKNLTKRRLKIVMPGNFQLSSGFNINLIAPSLAVKEKGDSNEDVSLSGKYIIVATRHIIGYEKHETLLEVATTSTQNEFIPVSHDQQSRTILEY